MCPHCSLVRSATYVSTLGVLVCRAVRVSDGSSSIPSKLQTVVVDNRGRSATYVSTSLARALCLLCVRIRRRGVPRRCSVAVAEAMLRQVAWVMEVYQHTA